MAYRAAVVGGSGYTGAELLRLLAAHPDLDVVHVTADSNAGATVASLYPSLAAAYPGLTYGPMDPGAVAGLDVVFLAMPHGASQGFAPHVIDDVAHVVDLGADFRLPAATYEQWYGSAHTAPELIDRFGYGLVELNREALRTVDHVAVPGCYPTAALLALAPLFAAGLVEPHVIVDAMSGLSGAGTRAQGRQPLLRGRRERRRLRTADAPSHRRDRADPHARSAGPPSTRCSRRTSCRWCAASTPPATPAPLRRVCRPPRCSPPIGTSTRASRSSSSPTSRRPPRPRRARTPATSRCDSTSVRVACSPWASSTTW